MLTLAELLPRELRTEITMADIFLSFGCNRSRSLRQDVSISIWAHTLVLAGNGSLYVYAIYPLFQFYLQLNNIFLDFCSFGYNAEGQLGTGDTTNQPTPVRVNLGIPIASVEAGWTASYILAKNGSVFSWGKNTCAAVFAWHQSHILILSTFSVMGSLDIPLMLVL
jgi:hypothetical protein